MPRLTKEQRESLKSFREHMLDPQKMGQVVEAFIEKAIEEFRESGTEDNVQRLVKHWLELSCEKAVKLIDTHSRSPIERLFFNALASTRDIAQWAIQIGRWQPQRGSLLEQCAEELSRAMREEHITDAQGRSVRAKHAARLKQGEKQITLWADIRTASREHMARAFQQRRRGILGDCRQLKADVDSYNENRVPSNPIQVVFDFSLDLAELEAGRNAA